MAVVEGAVLLIMLIYIAAVLLVFLGGLFFFNRMETVCGANPLGTDTILLLHAELSGHFQPLLVVLPQQPGVLVTGIPSPGRHF